jgi:hypothetical protein
MSKNIFQRIGDKFSKKDSKTQEVIPVEVLNSEVRVRDSEKNLPEDLKKEVKSKRKQLLSSQDSLSKEEVIETIEKYYNVNNKESSNNPFKTREDCYVTFYRPDGSILKEAMPFEEVNIGNRKFIINKSFENGEIVVKHLFHLPQLEINLEEEYNNRESTKKRLDLINRYLKLIRDKISEGDVKYKLIDIKDFQYEKIRLEKILDSIKYGKSKVFEIESPTTRKKTYCMVKDNDNFFWMKLTETGYFVPEHNSRASVSSNIIKDVQKILNMRKQKTLGDILKILGIVVLVACTLIGLFQLMTFDEKLFDERVKEGVESRTKALEEERDFLRGQLNKNGIFVPNWDSDGEIVPDFREAE